MPDVITRRGDVWTQTHMEGRPGEDNGRRWTCASPEQRPQEKPTLLTS